MGIYLFKRKTLEDLLTKTDYRDFGKEIFPASVRSHRVQVFLFDGYWEDIGTIRSFFDANLGLAAHNRPFDLASEDAPIYTRARFLAPSRLDGASVKNSLVADGCLIESGSVIENSVIGVRCRIGRNVTIRNSVLMGADFYCSPEDMVTAERIGDLCVGIGDGSVIEGAIIDKDCRIGRDVRIVNERQLQTAPERDSTIISDGIVVVEKGASLKNGWRL
jgi:glucose-1-phosphate adenylyltransferase